MNIVVYVPVKENTFKADFIVGTFFPLIELETDHKLYLITNNRVETGRNNTEVILTKVPSYPSLLKRLLTEIKLASILKKTHADLFISADNSCLSTGSIPQCIFYPDIKIIKPRYLKKARLIVVMSFLEKNHLVGKYKISEAKISVIYPPAGSAYTAIGAAEKESIRSQYSDGKEFFLCSCSFSSKQDLIKLLKSYSYFKKRLQSNLKLLLFTGPNSFIVKILPDYKYRDDVKLIEPKNERQAAIIMAAAYAVVFPFNETENLFAAMNVMQCGVPMVTLKNSVICEVAQDAVLYADDEIRDFGEKMMQLYKDENLRSRLIKNGMETVKKYNPECSAELLWQSIMKAMN